MLASRWAVRTLPDAKVPSSGVSRHTPLCLRCGQHGMAWHPPQQGPWPVVDHGWHPIPPPTSLTSVLISGRTDPSSRTPGKRASRPLALSWYCETRPCSSLLAKLGVHAAANFGVSAGFHGNCGPRSGARSTLRHAVLASTGHLYLWFSPFVDRETLPASHFSAGLRRSARGIDWKATLRKTPSHPQRTREVTGGFGGTSEKGIPPLAHPPPSPKNICHV